MTTLDIGDNTPKGGCDNKHCVPECYIRADLNNFVKFGTYLFIDLKTRSEFTLNVVLYDIFFSNVHYANLPVQQS